jgi:hypothetical protein
MFREVCEDLVMQRVNEYRFYELGQKLKDLHAIEDESLYSKVWYPLWEAREALKGLKQDVVAFRVSLPAVDRLINAITSIVPSEINEAVGKIPQVKDKPTDAIGISWYELSEALKQFEPVLAAECSALDTYVISQKRGYSTPDLVERSDVMLPLETRNVLQPSIIADIKSSGRCLAFDVPTAAGFHVLRAVEAVMAAYYRHLTGRELQKRNRNWAIYLKKLQEVATHSPKIYGALDHIRVNYRNPISHPEDTLTEGDAIMLFGLSLSSIELMAEVIRSTTPVLPEVEQLAALSNIAEQKASEVDDF